ncbi:hypothetical protein AKJ16_DCAP21754 [Drosera capensis]
MGHSYIWSSGDQQCCLKGKLGEVGSSAYLCPSTPTSRFFHCRELVHINHQDRVAKPGQAFWSSINNIGPEDTGNNSEGESFESDSKKVFDERFRESLERMVGSDDSNFNGTDLATLIRNKSFPLTEEYILRLDDVANTLKCWGAVSHIRSSLAKLKERPRIGKACVKKGDGASSLCYEEGKMGRQIFLLSSAVSIFIDMDESGGRSNEWIYK